MVALYNGNGTIIFENYIVCIEVPNDPVRKEEAFEVTANIHYGERGHMTVTQTYSTLEEATEARICPWKLLVDAGVAVIDFENTIALYEAGGM